MVEREYPRWIAEPPYRTGGPTNHRDSYRFYPWPINFNFFFDWPIRTSIAEFEKLRK